MCSVYVYVYVYVCVVSVCLCVWVCLCVNYSMVVGLYGLGVGVWCGCVVCRRAVYRLPPICGGRSASRESQPQLLPPVQEGRKLHRDRVNRQCSGLAGEGAGEGWCVGEGGGAGGGNRWVRAVGGCGAGGWGGGADGLAQGA